MLTIRRFQTGDENALSALIRRTLREVNYTSPKSELDYLIPHYSPETMTELSRTGHTYVLEEDGQIVGSGTVLPDGETEAEIVAAFLIPESIGRGYGRKLFETLEADELAVKAERVWLTSSDMALGFYEHMGWVNPNGYRVRAGEENLLYMEKRK
nr:GNAT family N-acetyltransferase [uncultured Dysosmobacter sp.]